MKRRYQLLSRTQGILSLLMTFSLAHSQTTVSGRVTDAQDDIGMPGVNILVKGTTTGTSTGVDGEYSLSIPDNNSVLVYSFTGFASQDIPVNGRNTIDVALEPSGQLLSEVVGYGTRRKSDLTGSVSQVSSKDFKEHPIIRVEDAPQGRASGVIVSRSSGNPGGNIKVHIRGINSITGNNDPL